jgi:hypothetical protein
MQDLNQNIDQNIKPEQYIDFLKAGLVGISTKTGANESSGKV